MTKIIIIGGHGKVALLLTPLLSGRGDDVTSVVRQQEHLEEVAMAGGAPVLADIETTDTDALAALIAGHDAVVWSAGAGGGDQARTYAVDRDAAIRSMDAALAADVSRYVMVSYSGAGKNHGVPESDSFHAYAEAKAAADEHLRASGLDYTILGPSALTLDPASGTIAITAERGTVSRGNVAAVIAEALEQPTTIGKTIEFIDGDEPITEALARV